MKNAKFTDEELLSYLIGDSHLDLSNDIKKQLKIDSDLRKRIETIAFMKGEIRNIPITHHLKKKKEVDFRIAFKRMAFSFVLFAVGVFSGINLDIISVKNNNAHEISKSVSKPLSWDESKLLLIM